MFNWFWEFLYMISKTIFRIIDGLIFCANKLCGIDPISFDGEGEGTDFLSYLMFSDKVGFAFRVSAILAAILIIIFTVFMIIRNIAKDKSEGTSVQIAIKTFKTLLLFFLVPSVMIVFMSLGNTFVVALYEATQDSSVAPGTFLFSAFAEDGGMSAEYAELFRTGELDYTDNVVVSQYMDLSNFPFIFSYLAGGVALFGIGSAMFTFVDRVFSLVILYIAAPVSISTSVLDDGARFKLWRDQFLSKFIMGYGMILSINIYAMVCGLVMAPGFAFFEGTDTGIRFLDLIMKLLIIGGGALTMQKSMALIGNLVSSGAGSNELRDSVSAGGLAKMAKGAAGMALGIGALPLRPIKSILGDAVSMKSRDLGSRLLDSVGLGMKGNTSDKDGVKDPEGKSGSKNNEKPDYGSQNSTKNAINNEEGFKTSFGKDSTNNNNSQKKDSMLTNAISGDKKDDKKGSGDKKEGEEGKK